MLALLSVPGNEYCLSEECTLLQAASLLSQSVTLVGPADSHCRKQELYSLLRLNLASVKWQNGKIGLFLFFPRLCRASWLGSRENLWWIRTEVRSRKNAIFRFENAVARGFWSFS